MAENDTHEGVIDQLESLREDRVYVRDMAKDNGNTSDWRHYHGEAKGLKTAIDTVRDSQDEGSDPQSIIDQLESRWEYYEESSDIAEEEGSTNNQQHSQGRATGLKIAINTIRSQNKDAGQEPIDG